MLENRNVIYGKQAFRCSIRQRPKPCPESSGKNKGIHTRNQNRTNNNVSKKRRSGAVRPASEEGLCLCGQGDRGEYVVFLAHLVGVYLEGDGVGLADLERDAALALYLAKGDCAGVRSILGEGDGDGLRPVVGDGKGLLNVAVASTLTPAAATSSKLR